MLADLVRSCRTVRRFRQDSALERGTLEALADMARLTASSSNWQPLKYWISCSPETNARIFPYLGWAGHMKDWSGPAEGERPAAYITILGDRDIADRFSVDHGIATQTIALGAAEQGIGTCMICDIRRVPFRREFAIPERFEILLVLALGVPAERVVIEPMPADGDIRYWRDADGVHHVPKRDLKSILVEFGQTT